MAKPPALNIDKAIKHPGALTKKANAAGESPMTFAKQHEHDSGKTGDQARFAITLRGLNHGHQAKHHQQQAAHHHEQAQMHAAKAAEHSAEAARHLAAMQGATNAPDGDGGDAGPTGY